MAKYKVLSTKKLSPPLIEKAKQKDIDIIEKEFIITQPIFTREKVKEVLDWVFAKKEYAAFTSANAVLPFKQYLHQYDTFYIADWKIFCLEAKTKTAVLENSTLLGNIMETAENAKALAQKIKEKSVDEIIFFCGNKRRDELPGILKDAGIKVHEVVVYETQEVPLVTTNEFDGVLFFSPSAVQSFFSVNKLSSQMICFATGPTTAAALADFTHNKIITSEAPGQEMMMACVQTYFQHINCYE
jgi:uroporphyrinogen-III synthase